MKGWSSLSTTAALFLVTFVLLTGASHPVQPDKMVKPADTDKEIETFNNPHGIYLPVGTPRNELLLFLPGTNPKETQVPGARKFCRTAAACGYHVVYLMYPNDISAAEVCRRDSNPEAFSEFRHGIIEGANTPYISIKRPDSIENRTIKLLEYLDKEDPQYGWGQFLKDGGLNWAKIAVAGQSQGGGHAAWIATKHAVARVLCFGSPKDFSANTHSPAKWYASSVTPLKRYFAFNNVYDKQGCDYEELRQNLRQLGIEQFGLAEVDKASPPYRHARVLFTRWPGHAVESKEAHTSVIRDNVVGADGRPIFEEVWRYMLTEPLD